MKRKLYFVLLSLLCISIPIYAAEINETEAIKMAKSLRQKNDIGTKSLHNRDTNVELAYTAKNSKGNNLLYAFNYGVGNGYAIIAADDCVNTTLGYADNGSFDYANMPESMKWWLSEYERQIEYAKANPQLEAMESEPLTSSVEPLLGDINWYQNAPYNNACPKWRYQDKDGETSIRKCYTGCVATAMAQVMRYYKYPQRGKGTHSYEWNDTILTADYGNTVYDWDNMLPTYKGSTTEVQDNAVATLMYQVGVSVNMVYGTNESGAMDCYIAPALVNNFGYDNTVHWLERSAYSISEWESIIRKELDAKRPVIYCGQGFSSQFSGGGHCFVCDGYNSDGLVHINWGWNGDSNGYFRTSALKPVRQGIGGSITGDFSFYQELVIGIQPKVDDSPELCTLRAFSVNVGNNSEGNKSDSVNVVLEKVNNIGYNTVSGIVGMSVLNENGEEVATIDTDCHFNDFALIEDNTQAKDWKANFKVLPTLPDGTYALYPVAKFNAQSKWNKIDITTLFDSVNNCVKLVINGDRVILSDSVKVPKLIFSNVDIKNLDCDSVCIISASAKNIGSLDFHNTLQPTLFRTSNLDYVCGRIDDSRIVPIAVGDSANITFTGKFKDFANYDIAAGEYILKFRCSVADNRGIHFYGEGIPVKVSGDLEEGRLVLTDSIKSDIPNMITWDSDCLSCNIKNEGRTTGCQLNAVVYDVATGNKVEDLSWTREIENGANAVSLLFVSVSEDPYEDGKQYRVTLFDVTEGQNRKIEPAEFNDYVFTFYDEDPTSVEAIISPSADAMVYPNPVSDVLNIRANAQINKVEIFDMLGNMLLDRAFNNRETIAALNVSSLASSIYVVRISTANGVVAKTIEKM